MKTGDDGAGKTRDRVRDAPAHPHLLPLLRMLTEGRAGSDRLFPIERVRDAEKLVGELRRHLRTADVNRPELDEGTATLHPVDVRSFRTTLATWCTRSSFRQRMDRCVARTRAEDDEPTSTVLAAFWHFGLQNRPILGLFSAKEGT